MKFVIALALIGCRTSDKPISDTGTINEQIDQDGDGFVSNEDCNDADPQVYPGAEEVCDGIDNNCDGQFDEEVTTTFYADSDSDGYGNPDIVTEACEQPSGYVPQGTDCDDTQSSVYPSAEEVCDGLDNDCNEEIDEGLDSTYFADADGDGFGDDNNLIEGCILQEGISTIGGDCDDSDPSISPLANEICDEIDNNCDGSIDEGVTTTFYADADIDGFGDIENPMEACSTPENYVDNSEDCDDTNTQIHPDAWEQCDTFDNNCDGIIDEDGALGSTVWYEDGDEDGYGDFNSTVYACAQPTGYTSDATDCDDSNNTINPGAAEICNAADDDCDGETDEEGSLFGDTYYIDSDGDGFGSSSQSTLSCAPLPGYSLTSDDCDDSNNTINPSATETCNNLDDDCDGDTDEDATDAISFYTDTDGDGFGDDNTLQESCTLPSNAAVLGGDCDDTQASVNPVATEICDGNDNDCNGQIDDSAVNESLWYIDADEDGYGDPTQSIYACEEEVGYSANALDCDDTLSAVNPDATEIENDTDDNCDGLIDEGTPGFDNDGDGYSASEGDCDDADDTISPVAQELCDGTDNNCDGNIDDGVLGDSPTCPGIDCQDILSNTGTTTDGVYWIDPDDDGDLSDVRQAYCDMNDDGGGWTKLHSAQFPFFFSTSNWDVYGNAADSNYVFLSDLDDFAENGVYTLRYEVGSSSSWLDVRTHYTVWTQEHNPFTAATNGSGYTFIDGEESTTCGGFNGLHNTYQGWSRATDVDTTDGASCWWQQVIPTQNYNCCGGYLEGYGGASNGHSWQSTWVR